MGEAKPLAFVLGGLEVVRALGMAGIGSAVAAPPGDPLRFSRYVRAAIDPDSRSAVEALLDFGRAQDQPPVLYYDSDAVLLSISRERDRLAEAFRFVVPDTEAVEDLVDKARFQRLAERLELPVPPARVFRPADSGPEAVDLAFPLVLKAVPYRDDRWSALGFAAKVVQVDDRRHLERLWPQLAGSGVQVLAQELVPGSEVEVLSYHVYVDAEGAVAGEFTGRKIRTWPPEFGMSSALVTTDDPAVAAAGRELVERLGFRGVAKIDFKRAHDGRLHLLEVNPRFTLWVHPGAVAGVNLPALVHADVTGAPRPPAGPARAGVRWVSPRLDAAAARAEGISRARWLAWALRAQTSAGFAWSDPGPTLRPKLQARRRSAP